MMFRRDLRCELPTLPDKGPVLAVELCHKLAASRDKAQGRRSNCRAIAFELGEPALMWNQSQKRYEEQVTVQAPNPGLDGASRSYWIRDNNGRQKLVHTSWLIKVPAQDQEQVQGGGRNSHL